MGYKSWRRHRYIGVDGKYHWGHPGQRKGRNPKSFLDIFIDGILGPKKRKRKKSDCCCCAAYPIVLSIMVVAVFFTKVWILK